MSVTLVINVIALILLLVLLAAAERALIKLTRRHLDRSRRVIRAIVFLLGIGGWGWISYFRLFPAGGEWWFVSFLVVAGVWKLLVDVLIFGVPERVR
jgi:hypothetical protein